MAVTTCAKSASIRQAGASFASCQRRMCYRAAKSHGVELAADGTEAGFDVANTVAVGQLSECHRQILIPTGQSFQIATTTISVYALLELLVEKELDR
jgi:hypothetical protein